MTDRENVYKYFEEIARSHVSIRHDPAQTEIKKRRFFQMETTAMVNAGNIDMVSSYVLLLEGHEGKLSDNRGDHMTMVDQLAFLVLHHARPDDLPGRRSVYNTAFEIGIDIIARIRSDVAARNTRHVDAAINCPFSLPVNAVRYQEVGQPVFTNAIGYRFAFDLITDQNLSLMRDNSKWV